MGRRFGVGLLDSFETLVRRSSTPARLLGEVYVIATCARVRLRLRLGLRLVLGLEYLCAAFCELVCDSLADATGCSGYDGYFSGERWGCGWLGGHDREGVKLTEFR